MTSPVRAATTGIWLCTRKFNLPWFGAEHSPLQFRVETFNTFNHPQWISVSAFCSGLANADGTPAFGRTCGGTAYNSGNGEVGGTWAPRNIQLGMKFLF